jgi:DNA/RNA endonuclease YhcR with UshA esterase domain
MGTVTIYIEQSHVPAFLEGKYVEYTGKRQAVYVRHTEIKFKYSVDALVFANRQVALKSLKPIKNDS